MLNCLCWGFQFYLFLEPHPIKWLSYFILLKISNIHFNSLIIIIIIIIIIVIIIINIIIIILYKYIIIILVLIIYLLIVLNQYDETLPTASKQYS